jgi:DNA-binding transcriptional LysR family regulator
MDRLESMSTFVAVVEAGSFSAASRKLGMPLASVSRKVSELEEHLGAQLLVRSTRSLALTDAGQDYFASCRLLLEQLSEAERLASGQYRAPKGLLVVGAPVMFGRLYLAPIVLEFLKAYPEIDIELRLGDAVANMIEDQIDVAVRIGHLTDSGLMAVKAGVIRHVVSASPAYLANKGTPEHPRDLVDHDCITLTPWESPDEWSFSPAKRTEKFPVRSRFSVTTAETALDAAVAGLGISHLFCYQVSRALAAGQLRLLMRDFEPEPFPVHLVYPSRRHSPLKLRAFLDFALPRLKAKLVFDP